MKTVVVDPGHGGTDAGGPSLGTSEKVLALRYALRLASYLRSLGISVILTRETDVFIPLSERADTANEAGADLFVSIHANASENSAARGPWTVYAKGSTRGQEIAEAIQMELVGVLGGRHTAVYPDESPWVGNRRLAVLRQTRMPAVLIELGFMTNAPDLALLEDAQAEKRACHAIASGVAEALGVKAVLEIDHVTPKVTPPIRPDLRKIEIPRREHVAEIVRVRQLDRADALPGVAVAEALLRGVLAAHEGGSAAVAKLAADALSDWLKDRAA